MTRAFTIAFCLSVGLLASGCNLNVDITDLNPRKIIGNDQDGKFRGIEAISGGHNMETAGGYKVKQTLGAPLEQFVETPNKKYKVYLGVDGIANSLSTTNQ